MTTLQDLLVKAQEARGLSGRQLAELAASHGHQIDRTQVNALIRGTYKSRPGRAVVEAVAFLAAVDADTAYEAAGLPLPGPPFAKELPPDVDRLGPQQRHAVITVIRAFLGEATEEGGEGRADSPAPNTGAGGPGAELLDLAGGRQERRRRVIEDAQPDDVAAYDDATPVTSDESDPDAERDDR